ncbi:MAG TPA: 6-phosphogluconolactonase [Thermoleophilaceae bacterium]|nr:6-phosphogluconolactonase [Thermoleophilaceae bacterium]
MTEPQIEVLDDPSAAVGELMADAAAQGKHIVLTGGSTPRAAYEHAAGLGADWSRATFWFGDERCVPPDHEQSNFAMADKALLSKIEPAAVHRMQGELGPGEGAADYERQIRTVFGAEGVPSFDLILLGLGPDAHCASLFPGEAALSETEHLVTGVDVPGMAPLVPRITFTLPLLNAGTDVVFLVAGEEKAEAAARAFGGLRPGPDAPSSLVRPSSGSLRVLLDRAAAAHL